MNPIFISLAIFLLWLLTGNYHYLKSKLREYKFKKRDREKNEGNV